MASNLSTCSKTRLRPGKRISVTLRLIKARVCPLSAKLTQTPCITAFITALQHALSLLLRRAGSLPFWSYSTLGIPGRTPAQFCRTPVVDPFKTAISLVLIGDTPSASTPSRVRNTPVLSPQSGSSQPARTCLQIPTYCTVGSQDLARPHQAPS